jgi:predicted transglutaminase-like cysteine proteinase
MANQRTAKIARNIRLVVLGLGISAAAPQANTAEVQNIPFDAGTPLAISLSPLFVGGLPVASDPAPGRTTVHDFRPRFSVYSPNVAISGFDVAPSNAAASSSDIDHVQTATISGVFGSTTISMRNFPVSARWAPIFRNIGQCAATKSCEGEEAGFASMVDALEGKGFHAKLGGINRSVNGLITYRKDRAVYGKVDHWASPAETLDRLAGDCEDFAILKMAALLKLGIPARSMSLVVLQDRRRDVFHAVLSVSTGRGNYILDNLSNTVVKDSDLPDYMPLYSFSAERAWIHGSRTEGAQVSELRGGFASIAPGEGPNGSAFEQ